MIEHAVDSFGPQPIREREYVPNMLFGVVAVADKNLSRTGGTTQSNLRILAVNGGHASLTVMATELFWTTGGHLEKLRF